VHPQWHSRSDGRVKPPRSARYRLPRRAWLATAAVATTGLTGGVAPPRPRRLVVRSSWQTVNIGDIAHTPGILRLLETHLPNVEVWLWPSNLGNGVRELLSRRFPRVRILDPRKDVAEIFAECDFLLHGSGPSLVARRDLRRWREETGKPYGVYGITLDPFFVPDSKRPAGSENEAIDDSLDLLATADFVFFRDSRSLAFARDQGCPCPIMEFGPDAAFATDLRDDPAADRFLQQHDLEPGRFLCCIPRYRFTPYWRLPEKGRDVDPVRKARNDALKEHDHAPHRQAIERVVRETGLRVLVCPEDRTQMAIGKEMLVDPLPADVRRRVVWRPDYWLTGEAISTYVRSAGLFGNEMHSPIMAVGNGVPAIVCRWREQTTKGFMWQDIGLGDWLFDMDDEADVQKIVPAVLKLAEDQPAASRQAAAARRFVEQRQGETMAIVRERLSG
jgi:hypothetical protein